MTSQSDLPQGDPASQGRALHLAIAREWTWRILVFLVALTVLVVISTRWNGCRGAGRSQTTDDAYLQSDITPISTKVAGYVRAVPVDDFQRVQAGQLIAELAADDYRAAVAQSEANVSAARAQVQMLEAQHALQQANLVAARAVIAATSAQLAQSGRDLARQKQLLATGSSSLEASEKVQTTRAQLSAQLAQNQAQAAAAERQLAVLAAQADQARAALAGQEAALQLARINLGYTRILAPSAGVLGQQQVKVGQYLGAGGQVASLTGVPRVWVIANFKETQLAHMALGDAASVQVDAFPGHRLKGHVLAFAPASGSQFALLPPDNATGNFTKVVQRIAVKIAIDDADDLADRIRPGMSVIAKVDTRGDRP